MRGSRVAGVIVAAAVIGSGIQDAGAARLAAPTPRVTLLAGLQGGQVYRSTDDGTSWQETDGGLPSGVDITALAVSPGAGGLMYAGTGGSGIYVSTDNGSTWQGDNSGNSDLAQSTVNGLAVDPLNINHVVAAVDQTIYTTNNGGLSWAARTLPLGSHVTSLAIDPKRPSTVLVGTGGAGLYLSTDGARTWQSIGQTSVGGATVNQVSFSWLSADVAFAATGSGLFQSIDGGLHWQADINGIPSAADITAVAASPRSGANVLAGAQDGTIYGTIDGGTSWTIVNNAYGGTGTAINAILFDPAHPDTIFAAIGGGGLYASTAGGTNWNSTGPFDANNSVILCLVASERAALPTDRVNPPQGHPQGVSYFSATGHLVRNPFLVFYKKYGGLGIFGLPLTEAFDEHGHLVQYFERAELVNGAGGVQEGALGSALTQGRHFAPIHAFTSTPTRLYFSATKHSLSGDFLTFWRNHHGQQLFGSPISEPLREQNGDGTGRIYLVQYFQNARLEYHPELAGTKNVVSLGLLGRQSLQQRGWL